MRAREFLAQTVEDLGAERAQDAIGAVLEAITTAQNYHDLRWPLEHVSIGFSDWPEVVEGVPVSPIVGLSNGYFGFSVLINKGHIDESLSLLEAVAVHEVTHIAQDQYAWVKDESLIEPRTFLHYVINEGVAVWHETQFLNEWAQVPSVNPRLLTQPLDVAAEIGTAGVVGKEFETIELHRFLLGDDQTPKKGYRVGVAVVDYAVDHGFVAQEELIMLDGRQIQELCDAYCEGTEV